MVMEGEDDIEQSVILATEPCEAKLVTIEPCDQVMPTADHVTADVNTAPSSAVDDMEEAKVPVLAQATRDTEIKRKIKPRGRRKRRSIHGVMAESCNSTGWLPLLERLKQTDAHILFAHEHRVPAELIAEKSKMLLKLGWKSAWSAATSTAADGDVDLRSTSGGTAIFVRKFIGLGPVDENHPDQFSIHPGRAASALLHIPGLGQVVCYSVYFVCGIGWKAPNQALAHDIVQHKEAHGLPWIIGADWNMSPDEVMATGLIKILNGKIYAPVNAETCVSPNCARTLDFFAVDERLEEGVDSVETVLTANTRPHRPAQLMFKAGLKGCTKTVYRTNEALPTEPIIGPVREPPSSEPSMNMAKQAIEAFNQGRTAEGFRDFEQAFGMWATAAEQVVAQANDLPVPAASSRAKLPETIKVPLVPIVHKNGHVPVRHSELSNAIQRTQEITAKLKGAWMGTDASWKAAKRSVTSALTAMSENYHTDFNDLAFEFKDACTQSLDFIGKVESIPLPIATSRFFVEYAASICAVADIRAALHKELNKEANQSKTASNKRFNDWKDKELDGAAGGAHRFSKEPTAWKPAEVYKQDGSRALTATDILDAEKFKYQKLWMADFERAPLVFENNVPLERPEPSKLRRIAKMFKRRTGVAPDGWHPRSIALLNDDLLNVMATLMELLERSGHLPAQQRQVFIFLLDKSSGGTRPIGLFTAFYRIWSKLRQEKAARWTATNDQAFFASGKGRSTTDPVWRQSIKNQFSATKGRATASICWDMRKFYERMSFDRLVQQAAKYDFDPTILNVALNAYRMGRVLTYNGQAVNPMYASHGIIAGDSLSDSLVKLYYIDIFKRLEQEHPLVTFDVYIDDIQISATGPRKAVAKRLAAAAADLRAAIENEMSASLALDKATVTSNDSILCSELRAMLGDAAGPEIDVAQFLGVDHLLAKERKVINRNSKWKSRIKIAKSRTARLRRLKSRKHGGATKIFMSGVLPAATYGAEVIGTSDADLKRLQDCAVAAMTPATRGRSRSALFVAKGDPTWRPAVAPAIRWAQEVWWAAFPRNKAAPALPLQFLKKAYDKMAENPPSCWDKSRGALDAAYLSLRRVGWQFLDHVTLKSDIGATISLKVTAPKLLSKLLQDSVQRNWQRKMATGLSFQGWHGSRVCADPVRSILSSKWAKKNRLEASYAVKTFCDAIWTGVRASEAGYACDGMLCPLCGKAEDSIEHRILACDAECAIDARKAHSKTFQIIKRNYASDKFFFSRGVWQHPADRLPRPPDAGGMLTTWDERIDEKSRIDANLSGGRAFCDGTCSRHPVAELRRAAWGVVFTSTCGSHRASVGGPVWANLPQTPQAAEYTSTVAAIQLLQFPTHIIGDCLGVVDAVNKLMVDGVPRGTHAGLLRDAADGDNLHLISNITWMPSHQDLGPNATPEETILHDGNKKVDEFAADMRIIEESRTGTLELQEAADTCKLAVDVLKALGTLLSQWPALPKAMSRKVNEPVDTLLVTHSWTYAQQQRYWRCTTCGVFRHGEASDGPPRKLGKCRPGRVLERHLMAIQLEHDIDSITIKGIPTVFCKRCAAKGSWQWRKLLDPCPGEPCTTSSRRWLGHALDGGAELNRPPVPRKRDPTKVPLKRKHKAKMVKDTAKDNVGAMGSKGLRSATMASKEERRRWEQLGNGDCETLCFPCLPLFPSPTLPGPAEAADPQVARHALPRDPEPQVLLRPLPPEGPNDDSDDEDCPVCAARVLATDSMCMQCGLNRATNSVQTDVSLEAKATRVAPLSHNGFLLGPSMATPVIGTRNPGANLQSTVLPQERTKEEFRTYNDPENSGESQCHGVAEASSHASSSSCPFSQPSLYDNLYSGWHGGTLVPPPYLTANTPRPEKRPATDAHRAVEAQVPFRKRARRGGPTKATTAQSTRTRKPHNPAARAKDHKKKADAVDPNGAAADVALGTAHRALCTGPGTRTRKPHNPAARTREREKKADAADLNGAAADAALNAADHALFAGPGPPAGPARLPSPGSRQEPQAREPERPSQPSAAQKRLADLLERVRAKQARYC